MVVDVQAPPMHLKLAGEETEIDLAALQGLWSVEQYLKLTDQTNRLIEYTDPGLRYCSIATVAVIFQRSRGSCWSSLIVTA